MKAVTWQGRRQMVVEEVPDPTLQRRDDLILEVTSTGLCGSDLHLYDPLSPFMEPGDIVGHEPMGVVAEVGPDVQTLRPGDRVVVPFNVSCGTCWMCKQGLQSQCETTQNVEHGTGASLFGYSKLYGAVPGAQAELLRVPFATSATSGTGWSRSSSSRNRNTRPGLDVLAGCFCKRQAAFTGLR